MLRGAGDAPAGSWRAMQVNLCGSATSMPAGCRPDGRSQQDRLARIAATIARHRPSVVTLNEACRGHVEVIARRLEAASRFVATVDGGVALCADGTEYGNAVLVRGRIEGEARTYPLGTPASPEADVEHRTMVCVDAEPEGRPALTACAVHLIPRTWSAEEHDHQLDATWSAVADERRPLLVGGDLNVGPTEIRRPTDLRDAPGGGPGPPTFGRHRYDYLLTSEDLGPLRSLDAQHVDALDHRMLVLAFD